MSRLLTNPSAEVLAHMEYDFCLDWVARQSLFINEGHTFPVYSSG